MAVRQKTQVLEIARKQFEDFGLPADIEYKNYLAIVGPKEALCVRSVKRSFKAWKYITHALKIRHPELFVKPEPKPETKPMPKSEPKPATPKAPKPAPKKAVVKPAVKPAVKKD